MFEMDWHAIFQSRELLLTGMWVTLRITLVAIACGLALGTLLAVCATARSAALNAFARGYVSLFRSIPLIMLLLWFFLIVPQFLKALFDLPPTVDIRLVSAMVAFALLEAAFFGEIIRAGMQSLPKGQWQAAQALGMGSYQTLRYVVLPQALKAMLPVLLTQCIVIFQDTSLVYVIALGDFFRRATSIGERDGNLMQMLLFAGATYWLICSALTLLVDLMKQGRRSRVGA